MHGIHDVTKHMHGPNSEVLSVLTNNKIFRNVVQFPDVFITAIKLHDISSFCREVVTF